MDEPQPFWRQLLDSKSILIAGAGGGFDVFCGLPLFFALHERGKKVGLASLSFANLPSSKARTIAPGTYLVDANCPATPEYFPERWLSSWFQEQRGLEVPVIAFEKMGVVGLADACRAAVELTGADAVVLVDGGADALLFGDESSLGTPAEDAASMVAVGELNIPTMQLACVGFGTDARHGVCHAHVLENIQTLVRDGGYLGAQALHPSHRSVQAYLDAFDWVSSRMGGRHVSYVSSAVCASIEGHFGELNTDRATRDRPPWCSPLVSMHWAFDLRAVLHRLQYRDILRGTRSIGEVNLFIDGAHKSVRGTRPPYPLPI